MRLAHARFIVQVLMDRILSEYQLSITSGAIVTLPVIIYATAFLSNHLM